MNLPFPDWITRFEGAVTVCDADLKIVYMNETALKMFSRADGASPIGSDLMACHNENSRRIIAGLLKDGGSNIYTVEKRGVRKLIHQSAFCEADGAICGLVELSVVLPENMPHHLRD